MLKSWIVSLSPLPLAWLRTRRSVLASIGLLKPTLQGSDVSKHIYLVFKYRSACFAFEWRIKMIARRMQAKSDYTHCSGTVNGPASLLQIKSLSSVDSSPGCHSTSPLPIA